MIIPVTTLILGASLLLELIVWLYQFSELGAIALAAVAVASALVFSRKNTVFSRKTLFFSRKNTGGR